MSTNSEQERERLKEEYKEHYRRIKEAKERLNRTKHTGKITEALNKMNADELLGSVDEFLGKVREKVSMAEARLDVAMDSMDEDSVASQQAKKAEDEEEMRKHKAKETLKQVKAEMGMLYSEIEKHAEEIKAEKTIGSPDKRSKSEQTGDDQP